MAPRCMLLLYAILKCLDLQTQQHIFRLCCKHDVVAWFRLWFLHGFAWLAEVIAGTNANGTEPDLTIGTNVLEPWLTSALSTWSPVLVLCWRHVRRTVGSKQLDAKDLNCESQLDCLERTYKLRHVWNRRKATTSRDILFSQWTTQKYSDINALAIFNWLASANPHKETPSLNISLWT